MIRATHDHEEGCSLMECLEGMDIRVESRLGDEQMLLSEAVRGVHL